MFDTFERSFDKLAMARVVIFGSGTKITILRSVTTALALALGMGGRRIFVDKNLRATAQILAAELDYDPDEVVELAVAAGLVTREEAN
jgi:hypothetical protein